MKIFSPKINVGRPEKLIGLEGPRTRPEYCEEEEEEEEEESEREGGRRFTSVRTAERGW